MMGRGGFFRNWRGLPFSGKQQQQTPGTDF